MQDFFHQQYVCRHVLETFVCTCSYCPCVCWFFVSLKESIGNHRYSDRKNLVRKTQNLHRLWFSEQPVVDTDELQWGASSFTTGILPGSLTVRPWKFIIPKGELSSNHHFSRAMSNFGSVAVSYLQTSDSLWCDRFLTILEPFEDWRGRHSTNLVHHSLWNLFQKPKPNNPNRVLTVWSHS